MTSTTIRVAAVLAAVVLMSASAWGQSTQPAGKPFGEKPAESGKTAPAIGAGGNATTATSQGTTQPRPGPCGALGDSQTMIFVVLGMVVLMMVFSGRGRRKQEAARRDMLANLKKGDKITTIGGIIGTVVDVREDEVVVKVDDETRMHLARWAIRGVGEESKAENPDQAKKQQEKK